ncbi:MAG TPA: enoyl-CoA hydratase/isomerase family protein [Verrucomicrobiae bacterium]|jgi:enoyl-CoA hydratase|nr:enoyl-CoA hydratase/isomerase family protein [Verrucomicrobiae bacterium]
MPNTVYEIKNRIGWITLNRPEAMNAMNQEMSGEIVSACRRAEQDESIGVVIFTGAGDKAFSSGMDLKERAQTPVPPIERRQTKTATEANTPTKAVAALTKPTIAAINGYAVGGGLELALACDLRIAATDAKLGLAEVRRGIIPGAGGTQRLARVLGVAKALELCLSGQLIDGRESFRIGLIHQVVAREELAAAAERLAETLLKGAPLSLRFIKEAILKGSDLPLEEGLRLEADLSALIAATEDAKEGPRAFAEKRPVVWKGK